MGMNVSVLSRTRWANKLLVFAVALVLVVAGLLAGKVVHADVTYSGPVDKDSNAVMYGGATSGAQLVSKYNNGDGVNSAASIHDIYAYFGISSAAVQAIPATAVMGSVTSSGDVFVGSTKVATNALTGGRQNIAGSTAVTSGGTTFYVRPPSVSFVSSPLAAYVVMNSSHQFQFAVIASCGNAVKATAIVPPAPKPAPTPAPTPKPAPTAPNYTIQKTVAQHGTNNYGAEIEVKPNTDVDFKIVISSTGSADVTGLLVKDTLPSDLTYVSTPQPTLMRDGQAVSASDATSFFGGGLSIGTLAHGTSTTFTFEALAGANQNNDNCNPETLPNVSNMTATNLPPESASATVSVICSPKMTTAIVVSKPAPPAPAPAPAPTVLPNTGTSAGAAIGVFSGVSVAGAAGYNWLLRRRLGR